MNLVWKKLSEFKERDPNRRYKGRVVILGDRVRGQHWIIAVFEELASAPAALEAGNHSHLP